jgi:hypothetical protein
MRNDRPEKPALGGAVLAALLALEGDFWTVEEFFKDDGHDVYL